MRRYSLMPAGAAIAACALLSGCGASDSDGAGSVIFTTWGEEYIEDEIPAADFEDGWTVRYSKFLVVIGGVRVADEAGEVAAEMPGAKLFNHATPGVKDVIQFSDIPARTWSRVSYEISPDAAVAELGGGATEDDKALMASGGYSVYVEGEATRDAVTKTFAWGFGVPTLLNDCKGERDGKETEGVIVTNGGADTIELTIHGDHLFYDDLQAANAKLRFDGIASADGDSDGAVTLEELASVKLVDLTEGPYGTGSAADVNNLREFVTALSRTVGHFRGEGECFVTSPK